MIAVNEEQFDRVGPHKVGRWSAARSRRQRVAVWGLTFKARTDDLRDSPALAVIERLLAARRHGPGLRPVDPDGKVERRQAPMLDGIEVVADPYAACDGAAVLAVLTEWDEFRWLDFDKVGRAPRPAASSTPATCSTAESIRRRGFDYVGIGRL